jgi:tetratricopeptide (TPR) repeat protein
MAERFLGNINEAKIYIDRAIKVVEENYGKDDPRLIDLLNNYLENDMFGSDPNSIKNINRLLAIIYKHNLMNTFSVISTWMALGNKSLSSYNYEDAKIYFERANNSLEKYKSIAGYEYLHYSIIMGIL